MNMSMNKNMFKVVETTPEIELYNGVIVHPVATIASEYVPTIYQIIEDDHCWVVCVTNFKTGKYDYTTHIRYEVWETLKTLDRPDRVRYEILKKQAESDDHWQPWC